MRAYQEYPPLEGFSPKPLPRAVCPLSRIASIEQAYYYSGRLIHPSLLEPMFLTVVPYQPPVPAALLRSPICFLIFSSLAEIFSSLLIRPGVCGKSPNRSLRTSNLYRLAKGLWLNGPCIRANCIPRYICCSGVNVDCPG